MSSKIVNEGKGAKRAEWSAPAIRNVVPLTHTRGGIGDVDDQDDLFYVVS
ncbi:hypothetical protein [Citromicrobium bathyomarinum]